MPGDFDTGILYFRPKTLAINVVICTFSCSVPDIDNLNLMKSCIATALNLYNTLQIEEVNFVMFDDFIFKYSVVHSSVAFSNLHCSQINRSTLTVT